MKRTLSILLCLVLLIGLLGGCMPSVPQPPEQEKPMTPEEIRSAALEKLQGAQSMGLDLKLSLSLDLLLDTEAESFSLALDLPGSLTKEPGAFQGEGSLRLSEGAGNGENHPFSLCVIATEGGLDLYGRDEDDETYEKLRLELPAAMRDRTLRFTLPELPWELETTETRYVLSHTVSPEEAARLGQGVQEHLEGKASEVLGQMAEYGFTPEAVYTGMSMRISVDKDSLEPREISMDISTGMKAAAEALIQMILGQIQARIEGAEGQSAELGPTAVQMPELQIKELRFVVSAAFHSFNSVAPIQAPAEYEDLGSLEELLNDAVVIPDLSDPELLDPEQNPAFDKMSESLDDSYNLEGFSFRLGEITPRTLTEQGWTLCDAVSMGRGVGAYESEDGEEAGEPLTGDDAPEQEAETEAPNLTEDGMLAPGGMAQLYLKPAGSESESNPLRLGVVNEGTEPCHCLDCPVRFFSVNEALYFEGIDEGLVDFGGPAGTKKGMTAEEIKALLGEPFYENSESDMEDLAVCYYLTQQGEELAFLLNSQGALAAMYYQDHMRYEPADYVFHN